MSQSKEPSDSDRVFALVKQIPEGKVMNYGQVGMSLDPPITARTVGWIMHRSEEDVPWWRVVGADGSILLTKSNTEAALLQFHMLQKEGVAFTPSEKVRMKQHRWVPENL